LFDLLHSPAKCRQTRGEREPGAKNKAAKPEVKKTPLISHD
jgi:hypothetical protein